MHSASGTDAFLSRLVIPPAQFLEIRLIVPDAPGASQQFCSTVEEAIAIATRASGTANVYVGACPRSRRSGSRDAVTIVIGAWADLDFHQIDSNRDLALELAYRRIEALGLPPTMLVLTGNGLQPWWLFQQPAAITDDWPAERFEAINHGLAQRMGGDHVHDLGRVLRVPGTMNLPTAKKRERGCVPVMARLLHANGPSYSPGDFSDVAVLPPPSPKQRPQELKTPLQPREEILAAFKALLAELGIAHPLTRTWHGDRLPRDTSRSGWDWALTRELYRVGVKDEFIPDILRAYSKGRGPFASDPYVSRTMQKARETYRGSHGSEQPARA